MHLIVGDGEGFEGGEWCFVGEEGSLTDAVVCNLFQLVQHVGGLARSLVDIGHVIGDVLNAVVRG